MLPIIDQRVSRSRPQCATRSIGKGGARRDPPLRGFTSTPGVMAMRGKLLIGTAAICLLVLTPSLLLAQMAARERSEIDEQYRWDLSDIFVSDEAWEADFAKWEKQ